MFGDVSGCGYRLWWVEAGHTARHPPVLLTAPKRDCLAPHVSCAEDEGLCNGALRGSGVRQVYFVQHEKATC